MASETPMKWKIEERMSRGAKRPDMDVRFLFMNRSVDIPAQIERAIPIGSGCPFKRRTDSFSFYVISRAGVKIIREGKLVTVANATSQSNSAASGDLCRKVRRRMDVVPIRSRRHRRTCLASSVFETGSKHPVANPPVYQRRCGAANYTCPTADL